MLASKSGMSCNNKLRPSQHRLHNRYQRLAPDYPDTRISGSSRRYFHEKYTALPFSIWYKCVCSFRLLKRLGELMAPQRFERFNALQNYQNRKANQANLAQLRANEIELRKLRQLLNEEVNKPKCPHCGGGSEPGYDVCRNCALPTIWIGHFAGKPGEEDELRQKHGAWDQQQSKRRIDHFEAAIDELGEQNSSDAT